ncbi:Hypothetical protein J6898_05210 [Nakaseomyces glabratus]
MVLHVRIDNLPPDKSWSQVRQLVGSIVPPSLVLQVKMLPPMSSMVPPFQLIKSCVVTLKGNIDQMTLQNLLMGINSYQWDYFDLYGYVIPYPMDMNVDYSNSNPLSTSPNVDTSNEDYMFMGSPTNQSLYYMPQSPPGSGLVSPPAGTTMTMPPPGAPPPVAFEYMMPPASRYIYQERPHANFSAGPAFHYGGYHRYNRHSNDRNGNYSSDSTDGYTKDILPLLNRDRPTDLNMISKDMLRTKNPDANSTRLKQIFNEISFRKQMTNRGMWQLKLENFPPFIQLDSLEPLSPQEPKVDVDIVLESNKIEKFGRLRWSILKDYIKLKCPKLLSLCESSTVDTGNGVLVSNVNNTREFYVGVYEDHEEQKVIDVINPETDKNYVGNISIEPGRYRAKVVRYSAVVGFHDKEICDLCLTALQGQEYLLGYKLQASELPPFEEEEKAN